MPNGIQQYVKLEERLLLLAWLNDLFGYQCNRDLLADMKEAEGFDAAGHSAVYCRLLLRGDKLKIPPASLAFYGGNIRAHLQAMKTDLPASWNFFVPESGRVL